MPTCMPSPAKEELDPWDLTSHTDILTFLIRELPCSQPEPPVQERKTHCADGGSRLRSFTSPASRCPQRKWCLHKVRLMVMSRNGSVLIPSSSVYSVGFHKAFPCSLSILTSQTIHGDVGWLLLATAVKESSVQVLPKMREHGLKPDVAWSTS